MNAARQQGKGKGGAIPKATAKWRAKPQGWGQFGKGGAATSADDGGAGGGATAEAEVEPPEPEEEEQ